MPVVRFFRPIVGSCDRRRFRGMAETREASQATRRALSGPFPGSITARFCFSDPILACAAIPVVNWPCMAMPPSPSQSAEDYLERIHELIEEKGYARVVDIASSLQVKQASVTSMVQKLGDLGYLNYEKYRGLVLTEKGKQVATNIQKRHETLSRFFSLFGLDRETQKEDIEGIEHHLSPDTVNILADLAQFFEDHPDLLRVFKKERPRS